MHNYDDLEDITKHGNNFDDEDDELDLIKLVQTNANDTSQYLIFVGSDEQYYAKNVSKIEELLVYKDLNIVKNNTLSGHIIGTADIRGNMTTIVNFDQWYSNEVLKDEDYELVVLAHYGGHKMGIVVKRVEYIVNIPAQTMTDNSQNNEKSSFITKVQIAGKEELCIIFDSDKMLLDVFNKVDEENQVYTKEFKAITKTQKRILFADDSKFIRKMVQDLFNTLDVNYNIYENGKELISGLENIADEDIGLVITDLEMPVLGGREVIKYFRENNKYDDIGLIVHTNMSNDVMEDELKSLGIDEIIGKVNMLKLGEAINKYMR